jgi:DNA-binding transcriptional ArsR family regulator
VTADPDAADFLAAVGETTRLRIVVYLAAGPESVSSVALALGVKPGSAGQHLTKLRRAGVLQAVRSGRHTIYRLAGAEVSHGRLVLRRPEVTVVVPLAGARD